MSGASGGLNGLFAYLFLIVAFCALDGNEAILYKNLK